MLCFVSSVLLRRKSTKRSDDGMEDARYFGRIQDARAERRSDGACSGELVLSPEGLCCGMTNCIKKKIFQYFFVAVM